MAASIKHSEVRTGHSVNEAERKHLARRRETILQCLKQHGLSCSKDEVPNIAVLGSGGGLRAMVGLLGSLSQLKEEGLLDCIKYLSGVSGFTWCMASLYKEPDWSTKLKTLKDNIVHRLAEGKVSWWERAKKLREYKKKDNFSLTDIWAALVVSDLVKDMDEHKLTEQRSNYANDRYPIYTAIDKQCKHDNLNAGLCGSALGDIELFIYENYKALRELIRKMLEHMQESPTSQTADVQKGCQVLLTLVELNLCVLREEDPTTYPSLLMKDGFDEIGKMTLPLEELRKSEGTTSEAELKDYALCVCNFLTDRFKGCMASLYKEADWSTNIGTVKNNIVQRLANGKVNWLDKYHKLKKYLEHDNFSLTDVWAVLLVSYLVKEIDENTLTEQRGKCTNDPYPIYTVIDKQCKHDELTKDVWFEITPDESGYSLSGAFVDSSCFGSQFEGGEKIKDRPEMDMLYLQGLCGSAIADLEEDLKIIFQKIIHFFFPTNTQERNASQVLDVKKGHQVLSTLVELNLCVLRQEDPTVKLKTMDDLLKELSVSKTEQRNLSACIIEDLLVVLSDIAKCIGKPLTWTWGTTYNFLYNMEVEEIDPSVLRSKTREYEDSGVLLNSPYFSVLRKERDIDLIISLDFSTGDPFETVEDAAKMCEKLHIPFPKVSKIDDATREAPQDFYVFEGSDEAPTVIHIPLFNVVNCNGDIKEWEERYSWRKREYSLGDSTGLMEKAGLNITNNKGNLIKEIKRVIERKKTSKLG